MIALDLVLAVLAAPALLAAGYLGLLTALSGRRKAPTGTANVRFAVVVPAHDEEAHIAAAVHNLLLLDYPTDQRRVVVVADNCGDRTAARAAAAGARVLIRRDPRRRGKGYALGYAFARLLEEGWAQAVVVVDADTRASPNLLRAFAARLAAGADAVQADNRVGNVAASWRPALMAVALGAFHRLRSLARERLGISCALAGNGMCFRAEVLRAVPHRSVSNVEDLEYTVRLAEAGRRIRYADEARVWSEIAVSPEAAASQRRRWDEGRRSLASHEVGRLLRLGIQRRAPVLLDLGVHMALPPLARLGAFVGLGVLAAGALAAARGPGPWPLAVWPWGLSLALLASYVLRGWQLSETRWFGARALLAAPRYALWKLGLRLDGHSRRATAGQWVRTAREGGGDTWVS